MKSNNITAAEEEKLRAIESKYRPDLDRLQALLSTLDMRENAEAYAAATREYCEVSNALTTEQLAVFDEIDRRLADSYQGTGDDLLNHLKKDLLSFLDFSKLFEGDKPTAKEEAENAKKRLKYKEEVEEGIKINERLLEDYPDDEELIKDTEELRELLQNLPPYSEYDLLYGDHEKLYERFIDNNRIYIERLRDIDGYNFHSLFNYIKETWAALFGDNDYDYIDPYNISRNNGKYRTRAKAQEYRTITNMPRDFATPTYPGFQYTVSFYEDDNTQAHLELPINSNVQLSFNNGKLFINGGGGLRELSEVDLENLVTKESIGCIDLPTLMVFYNIILNDFKENHFKTIKDVHTVYIPELLSYMGADPRINKEDVARVKKIVESYHNMIGVYYTGSRNGAKRKNRLPVLLFEGDSEEDNTISFSSPYLNHVIKTIIRNAIRRTDGGKVQKKKNGEYLLEANHSYLIDPSINKERNKAAVQNVFILVTGIEQAGGKGYHIAASTLIERNKQLAERLESDPQHRAQLLKRVFTKTWELLRDKTYLKDKYIDIVLPDPKDPAFIPTVKGLSSMVIEIKHEGKKNTL